MNQVFNEENKQRIRRLVQSKTTEFLSNKKEEIDFADGTSLNETVTMFTLRSVQEVLGICFEETWVRIKTTSETF